ncbi:MAG: phosphatase PAP2 family protein [Pyrinomonadaceae bacterium]|nr:phosphatase PAP2 family protein [Pyrinomonadaceae bacterium]
MALRFVALTSFLKARLSREGYYGLRLTIGALLLIGATWLFGLIAEDVLSGAPLTLSDVRFSAWLHAQHQQALIRVMLVITHLHSMAAVGLLTTTFALYLFRRRHRYWLIALLLAVFGGMFLNVVLKNIFHRARPPFDDPILTFSSYGFPSGHTMAATCFYGVVAAFATWKIREWPGRVLAVTLAVLLVLLVGFSRIYLGAHYLSDVLGAIMEGLAWLALCLTAVDVTKRVRHREKSSPGVS